MWGSRPLATEPSPFKLMQTQLNELKLRPYEGDGALLRPLALRKLGVMNPSIKDVKKELDPYFITSNKKFKAGINRTFIILTCNFVCAAFSRTPVSIPSSEVGYGKKSIYKKYRITWGAKERVVKALLDAGYIELFKKGNASKKTVNCYIPTPKFEERLFELLYDAVEDFDLKDTFVDGLPSGSLASDHPDVEALQRINKRLSKCTYALKAPVRRVFCEDAMRGGRLYTRMQTLPDRNVRIRINTLFNGNPVAEVDLSANHPRMIAALSGFELPADFYTEVANATGTSRDQVKFFYMKSIGAANRRISLLDEAGLHVLTQAERIKIEEHTKQEFPFLSKSLFTGVGVYLQALEGDILLKTMLYLLEEGIPSLPLHDAVYVERGNRLAAKEAIERSWQEVLDVGFKPITKIDMA